MVGDDALTFSEKFYNECAEGQILFAIELYDGKTVGSPA